MHQFSLMPSLLHGASCLTAFSKIRDFVTLLGDNVRLSLKEIRVHGGSAFVEPINGRQRLMSRKMALPEVSHERI
jgi:hypothetical protein